VATAHEAGLFNKWKSITFSHAQLIGLVSQAPYEPAEKFPLPLDYFRTSCVAYFICISFSLTVFVLECAYTHWSRRRTRLQRNRRHIA